MISQNNTNFIEGFLYPDLEDPNDEIARILERKEIEDEKKHTVDNLDLLSKQYLVDNGFIPQPSIERSLLELDDDKDGIVWEIIK